MSVKLVDLNYGGELSICTLIPMFPRIPFHALLGASYKGSLLHWNAESGPDSPGCSRLILGAASTLLYHCTHFDAGDSHR
jgi:hypothetical protein